MRKILSKIILKFLLCYLLSFDGIFLQSIQGCTDGIRRTNLYTFSATDTLQSRLILGHIHLHPTGLSAFSAVNASILIHLILEEGNLIEEGIEGSQRANPFTKGAEGKNR